MNPLARELFHQEIQQPDPQIDLARAALYIAQEEYPSLDPEEYLAALEVMATELNERLPAQRYPLRILQCLNHYLFSELGFHGNTQDYYSPDNSFLNQVIDQRTGIPITLSLLYLELARRIRFPMVGIGLPGHFLLKPDFAGSEIFVDAFHQGEVLFPEDCQARLAQVYGKPVPLHPQFLEPISPRAWLVRILTNLKLIYLQQADLRRALAATERILLLVPQALADRRDRGLIYYELGQWQEARQDLEFYLASDPERLNLRDREMIQEILNQIQG